MLAGCGPRRCVSLPAGIAFSAAYWYLFFLQKTRWNNHSYLFGTMATLLLCMDTTRTCSLRALVGDWAARRARRGPRRRWLSCCCGKGGDTCEGGNRGGGGGGDRAAAEAEADAPPSAPLWQLWLLRVLHFIVYFIAGCKKFASPDWFGHQSMTDLSTKPIFQGLMFPYVFMPVLNLWRWASAGGSRAVWAAGWFVAAESAESADLELFHHSVSWIIHATGLWFDLGVGWLLLTPGRARYVGMFLCFTFHAMTTQMFSIGMFPYMSLALLTIWLPPDWPQQVAAGVSACASRLVSGGSGGGGGGGGSSSGRSTVSIRGEVRETAGKLTTEKAAGRKAAAASAASAVNIATTFPPAFPGLPPTLPQQQQQQLRSPRLRPPNDKTNNSNSNSNHSNGFAPTPRQHATVALVTLLILFELFLPYSHFITRGYNTWTQGLYGYSWDMMIQTWSTQHIRVTITSPEREDFFIRPEAFVSGRRAMKHPDMLKQYAQCLRRNLRTLGVPDAGVKVDVWQSMNQRFQQRLVDPRVDLVAAPWSPWEDTPWILPCMFQFDDRRQELDDISDRYWFEEQADLVFVADFPGMSLEHYINATETEAAMLVLMDGNVTVEFLEPDPEGRIDEYGEEAMTAHLHTVRIGENVSLPGNMTHIVHTHGTAPSRFFYAYVREDLVSEEEKEEKRKEREKRHRAILGAEADLDSDWSKTVIFWDKMIELRKKTARWRNVRRETLLRQNNLWHQLSGFAANKVLDVKEGWAAFAESWRDVVVYGNGTVWRAAEEIEGVEQEEESEL
jgi:hypothetical protein